MVRAVIKRLNFSTSEGPLWNSCPAGALARALKTQLSYGAGDAISQKIGRVGVKEATVTFPVL